MLPVQVLLRHALQHGTIVIPKSANSTRQMENAQIFDWALSDIQMHILDALPWFTHILESPHFLPDYFGVGAFEGSE